MEDSGLIEIPEQMKWYLDSTVEITTPKQISDEALTVALDSNREILEELKMHLKIAVDNGDDASENYFRQEIKRTCMAIEMNKNHLAYYGQHKPFDPRDIENPEQAIERLSPPEEVPESKYSLKNIVKFFVQLLFYSSPQ